VIPISKGIDGFERFDKFVWNKFKRAQRAFGEAQEAPHNPVRPAK